MPKKLKPDDRQVKLRAFIDSLPEDARQRFKIHRTQYSKAGVVGIDTFYPKGNKWAAVLFVQGARIDLGTYDSYGEANRYLNLARNY